MALSEIYVDPSIAADSGAGTVGDPYGDLEYAIEQTTFDTTNGTRVNIKAGTDEVLAAELSLALEDTSVSVAWVPSQTAPCVFQGYTATAGDDGIGGISGGGSVSIYDEASGKDHISFVDLHLYNCGSAAILNVDDSCHVINCEINNTTGIGVDLSVLCSMIGCYVHDVGSIGINLSQQCFVAFNFIHVDTANAKGIYAQGSNDLYRNIITCSSSADGIWLKGGTSAINNSIYSTAGTGVGIWMDVHNTRALAVMNNLIEGFSGTGGIAIDYNALSDGIGYFAGNSVYDCATAYGTPIIPALYESGNETLTASPFTAAATNDFSPVDTGLVKEGSLPAAFPGP